VSWQIFFSRLLNPRNKVLAVEREIEEELRFHLEMLTSDSLGRGMRPEDAAAYARQQFGNYLLVKAACYRAKGREMARRKSIKALKRMTWLMLIAGVLIYVLGTGKSVRQVADMLIVIALLSRWLIYLRSSWSFGSGFNDERQALMLSGESTKTSI